MAGSSSKGAKAPYEAPNTLQSAQFLRIIDAISEGPVEGFAHGNDCPLKSVFFNDTSVQNSDNSFNFSGLEAFFQRGTPDQPYIPHFAASERTVSVGANVLRDTPSTHTITDPAVTRLRVTVGVERNLQIDDEGNTNPAQTELAVELFEGNHVVKTQNVEFTEKGSGAYYHDVVFEDLPPVPFRFRVRRITPDSTTDKVSNSTFCASYVEIIDAKLSYPFTALAALKIDSNQFGNSIPRRNYLIKGKLLKVPTTYDPETRTYAEGVWQGDFKTAWTNNPAWVFYDLLTSKRYSTLARRLEASDIDLWQLYQIAQYCDELVPDGFGGMEPRYVCNAYITDQRQAGEVLSDLASIFCGLPVWTGTKFSAVLDKHSDPVAQYTNSNVVNGEFIYASTSLKSIHTAVQVQYADKRDGYRTKTEYVEDKAAIERYGLNIKKTTAFGCDSRGQAVRFGKWILETELRQQHTVSFTVGREGLRHLPYDIIRIADNDYAGAEIGGRVVAVSGALLTLDKDVKVSSGSLKILSGTSMLDAEIVAQVKPNQVRLNQAIAAKSGDIWVYSGRVGPRLYRAISVKENTEDGTYTIHALEHDPSKYGAVVKGINFDRQASTLHSVNVQLLHAQLATKDGGFVLSWDNLSADGAVLDYDIKVYRDNKLFTHFPHHPTPEVSLSNLPNGDYYAEIRGRNARGVLSEPLIYRWRISYTITGLRTKAKTFAIEVVWTLPEQLAATVHTELWYGTEKDIGKAKRLANLPYPINTYTLTGMAVTDRFYFWARLVDENGFAGEWTGAVLGQSDPDPAPIVANIHNAITQSQLSKALIQQLKNDDAAAEARAKADAASKVVAEASARTAAIRAETEARANAIRAETSARNTAIQAAANQQATNLQNEVNRLNASVQAAANTAQANLTARVNELTSKDAELKQASDRLASRADELARQATALGNRVQAAENVNAQQAQAIQTVTAAQGNTAAALEAEKAARIAGDQAETAARNTLTAKVNQNTSAIDAERTARTTAQAAETRAREQLSARLDNVAVGGRNYFIRRDAVAKFLDGNNNLQNADAGNLTSDFIAVKSGMSLIYQIWATITQKPQQQSWTSYCFYDANRQPIDTRTVQYGEWRENVPFDWYQKINIQVPENAAYIRIGSRYLQNGKAKLEIGTLPTDWTPAPEDIDSQINAVQADLLAERTARANADQAETRARETLATKVSQNTAAIDAERTARTTADQAETRAREALAARVATAESGLTAERTARTAADTAQTNEINAAKSRLGAAESSINTLRTTVSNNHQALTQAQTNLTARLDKTKIWYLISAGYSAYNTNAGVHDETLRRQYSISRGIALVVFAADGAVQSVQRFDVYANNQAAIDFNAAVEALPNGTLTAVLSFDAFNANYLRTALIGLQMLGGSAAVVNAICDYIARTGQVRQAYLLVGRKGIGAQTEMYHAGDQAQARLEYVLQLVNGLPVAVSGSGLPEAIQADLNHYKTAQATKDEAQTAEINAAKSKISSNESSLNTLRTTKADKTEVASLARTTLQSEWRNDVNAAKTAAATDAQHKADAAKQAAIADATGKINAANAKITALESTVSSHNNATATQITNLQAALNKKSDDLQMTLVDLTALDENTWYPVTFQSIRTIVPMTLRVSQELGNQGHQPSWASHSTKSFSLLCEWEVNGSGWGTIAIARTIQTFEFSWIKDAKSPIILIGQLTNSSTEYCHLRGGAKYCVFAPSNVRVNFHTESFTLQNQTVSKMAYNADNVPKATLKQAIADITAERTARVEADNAQTNEINAAKSRLNNAESSLNTLRTTVANNQTAHASEINSLNTRLANVSVGGRNYFIRRNAVNQYLLDTGELRNADAGNMTSDFIIVKGGMSLIYQIWITVTAIPQSWTAWCFYDANRRLVGARTVQYGERRTETPFEWYQKFVIQVPDNAKFIRIGSRYLQTGNAKLEVGTLPTDWTPAPEDLEGATNDVQAALTAERTSRTTADNAQTTEINAAKTRIGAAESSINTLRTTVSNNQSATTSQINNLTSKLGTAEANIRTTQTATTTLNGKVQALHTLKVETVAGGKKVVAGLALGADGATGESQVNVHAQKFAVWDGQMLKPVFAVVTQNGKTQTAISGDLIADGTIQGRHIAAGQTIQAPVINGGSLNINNRFVVNPQGQVSINAEAGNVGLKVNNDRIEVFDERGVLRVRLGRL